MTAPDPIELTAPVDPAAYARPMRLGVVFWLLIGFGVLCVLGGAAIATFGPLIFPHRPAVVAPVRPAPPPAPAAASIDARLADIQARLATSAAASVAANAASASAPQVNALADRVDRLEAGQQRLINAAAGALAAASLTQAAETSRPFAGELGALEAALPASVDVRALRPLAETGAPTAAMLATQYPDVAARAAVAARARASGDGLLDRIARAFAAIVTVRRVDRLDGDGVDAILARAQRRVDAGDLAGADGELAALSPAGRAVADPWRRAARRRIEIDQRTQAIRAAALAELVRSGSQLRPTAPFPPTPMPAPAPAAPNRAVQGPPA